MLKRGWFVLSLVVLSLGATPAVAQAAARHSSTPGVHRARSRRTSRTSRRWRSIRPIRACWPQAPMTRSTTGPASAGIVRSSRGSATPASTSPSTAGRAGSSRPTRAGVIAPARRASARSARCRTTSKRPGLRRRPGHRLRSPARLERPLQLGERLTALLLESDLELRHRAKRSDLQGLRGDCGLSRRQPAGGSDRRRERVERSGDRHLAASERYDVLGQGGDLGRQRRLEPTFRDGVRLLHAVQEPAGHRSGADRRQPLDRRRRHLVTADHSEVGVRQPAAHGPPGLLDPHRQQRHRLRSLGGLAPEAVRLPDGPLIRWWNLLREAAHDRQRH